MTDVQLLVEYRKSASREAYREIVSRYADAVYATCLRTLSDAHVAEDAAQAAFLVLLKKGRKLPRKTVLAGWLHRTARNCAWNLKQAAARRAKHEREAMAVNARSSAGEADVGKARPEVDAALDSLPAAQRNALALRYLRGLSRAEVAAELGCPERTVESRLRIGLEKLRARLSKHGATLSAAGLAGLLSEEVAAPALLTASVQGLSLGTATASAAATVTAEAIMTAMMWTKVKLCVGAVLTIAVLGTSGAIAARSLLSADVFKPTAPMAGGVNADPEPPSVVAKTPSGRKLAPEKNAATYYRQAIKALPKVENPKIKHFLHFVVLGGPPSVIAELPGTDHILAAHAHVFGLMHRGAQLEKCDFEVDWSKGTGTPLPHAQMMREMARRAVMYGKYLQSLEKSGEEANLAAAQVHLDVVRMGLHLGGPTGSLIEEIVGVACANIGLAAIEEQMAGGVGPETAKFILDGLAALPGQPYDLPGSLRGETENVSRPAFRNFRRSLAGGSEEEIVKATLRLFEMKSEEGPRVRKFLKAIGGRKAAAGLLDHWEAQYVSLAADSAKACDGPYYRKRADLEKLEGRIAALAGMKQLVKRLERGEKIDVEEVKRVNPFVALLYPMTTRIRVSVARSETRLAGTRILAAACLEKADTGKFPASLGTLKKHFPGGIPVDPFTGKNLIYRIEKGKPTVESAGSSPEEKKTRPNVYVFSLVQAVQRMNARADHWRAKQRGENPPPLPVEPDEKFPDIF